MYISRHITILYCNLLLTSTHNIHMLAQAFNGNKEAPFEQHCNKNINQYEVNYPQQLNNGMG